MKKEVGIVIGYRGFMTIKYQCVNITGSTDNLLRLAYAICPDFCMVDYKVGVLKLWFYRDFMIFRDLDVSKCYCVPAFHRGTCRFSSLRAAKSAISRFYNLKGGAK